MRSGLLFRDLHADLHFEGCYELAVGGPGIDMNELVLPFACFKRCQNGLLYFLAFFGRKEHGSHRPFQKNGVHGFKSERRFHAEFIRKVECMQPGSYVSANGQRSEIHAFEVISRSSPQPDAEQRARVIDIQQPRTHGSDHGNVPPSHNAEHPPPLRKCFLSGHRQ